MKHFTLFLLFLISGSIECLERKQDCRAMKTSVIVPCHYKHFALLPELLNYYKNQTVIPDEVVISLSECDRNLEEMELPFVVKVIRNQSKMSAGQNRNMACQHCTGDLIICQDADDIPHPQRVEIIKYLFENYEIDHLMHLWAKPETSFSTYRLEELENLCSYFSEYKSIPIHLPIHNGNIALTRSVCTAIKWPEGFQIGEDVAFNGAVYRKFKFKVVIKMPLLIYRNSLSSFLK